LYSDELIISYFFPPSSNISGITLSKRIIANGKKVDVLTTNQDDTLNDFSKILNDYINNKIIVEAAEEKDSPEAIFEFVENSLEQLTQEYSSLTSRSWLMSNHFLAMEYKFRHPDTFWRAEFSDPLLYDVNHTINLKDNHKIDNQEYFSRINEMIPEGYPKLDNMSSTFFTVEYLTFLFADEIIFTNENQRDLMIRDFPFDVEDLVLEKAIISPHPTLPEEFYHKKETEFKLNDDYINMAYFGDYYYPNRNFEPIFYAINALNHKYKDKIRFYIFISNRKLLKDLTKDFDNIYIKRPLDYLEFLNASTRFDVLVVNDLKTSGVWDRNPYLPSKLSDYLGSGKDIWAVGEKGSSLDNADIKYKSYIDDYQSNIDALVSILKDRGFEDDEYIVSADYFENRLTYLNRLLEKSYSDSSPNSGNPSIVKKIFKKLR
jgi:hypothetical protein